MQGKVLFYNESTGDGLILSEDQKKYKLSAENWEDFDNMPKTGINVEFKPHNDIALNVLIYGNSISTSHDDSTPISIIKSPKSKAKTDSKTDSKAKDNSNSKPISKMKPSEVIKRSTTSDPTTKKSKKVSKASFTYENMSLDKSEDDEKEFDKLDGIKFIPITKSYKETFYSFFQDAIRISQSQKVEDSENTLAYPMMRRFLITAYEHLLDKDPTFVNKDLLALRRNLEDVYFIYKDISDVIQRPNAKFETLFLPQQEVYLLVTKKIQSNTKRIQLLSALVSELEDSLKEQEEEIKRLHKSSHAYTVCEVGIKKIRTRFVNGIDELSILKNENTFLNNISKDFVNKHKIEFIDFFIKNTDELLSQITSIMNKNAYKFDTYMWMLAKKSKGIKTFFIEAQIDGSFSSKTFLRYFIKNLDTKKMGREYREMQKMVEYLDNIDKKKILIIDDQSYIMPHLKYFANHIDKFYAVMSLSPTEALYKLNDHVIDYIIVDVHISKMKLFDFIDKVRDYYAMTKIILISDSFTKDILFSAKKKGIKHFVATNVSDGVLSKTLEGIITGKRD
jgi:CheY-like chemotaxis protein